MNIVLASSSPRRQALLNQIGINFILRTQTADESKITEHNPVKKVTKLAQLKADMTPVYDDEIVITADTIVSCDNEIFEKPEDVDDACRMMTALSGRHHQVHTAVVLKSKVKSKQILSTTDVYFYELDNDDILNYIHTNEPYDKAGGYGIQSTGARFVKKINGDYCTIVGLPAAEVYHALKNWDESIILND